MDTLILVLLILGAFAGIGAALGYFSSSHKNPKERAEDVATTAAGAAMFAGGCIIQLLMLAGLVFVGLMVLRFVTR